VFSLAFFVSTHEFTGLLVSPDPLVTVADSVVFVSRKLMALSKSDSVTSR
jgi:hypothetical protein